MIAGASRRSAAVAASLALHAAMLALLAGRAPVRLTMVPAPILLTFVEAAERTAGPGALSDHLQSAAPTAAPPAASMPEAAPVVIARPQPPQPLLARPKAVANKPGPAPSRPAVTAATFSSPSASGTESGAGTDARSSAPAWAPTVRVRYEELLFAWMDRHKHYPMLAQRRSLEGSGAVRVRIDRGGRVLERSLEKSTGEAMLDQAALDMVRSASPFPAVPAGYGGASFEFVAPIEYRLR